MESRKMTKCDYVAEQLKHRIFTGEYRTGDQLPPEAALCEAFCVSRITVRNALKKLDVLGLVDIQQGRGTFVRSIEIDTFMKPLFHLIDFDEMDVEAIYTAREYLESGTVALAAVRRTEEELALMRTYLQSIYQTVRDQDIPASFAADRGFHFAIAKAARNPILAAALQVVDQIDDACVQRIGKNLCAMDAVTCYTDHLRILEAIERQDPESAKAAMVWHARNSMNVLLD